MAEVRVLVIHAAGINCDEEIMHAWTLAGAKPELMHINRLAENPSHVFDFQIITIPGGFSYGDDIGAGVILAQRFVHDLANPLKEFVDRGGGILGVCNGFQVLVKAGLLPGSKSASGKITVTYNDSGQFEARWVRLQVCTDRCPYLTPAAILELPVEHAEGKVVTSDDTVLSNLERHGQIALRYIDVEGRADHYPANPNGSVRGIAGLCDATGRIFGLMPHPDRYLDRVQHPQWTRRPNSDVPDGLTVFRNAVRYWSNLR